MKLPNFFQKLNQTKLKWPLMLRVVSGHSMVPVLPPGTKVIANKWYKKLNVGDVVIILHEGKEKIKRISEIKDEKIYVLGDHEESSTDSRHYGWLTKQSVIAHVVWPHTSKN